MVDDIRSGKFSIYDLLAFFAAAVGISAIVEYIFPSEAILLNSIPILGEALTTLFLLTLGGLSYAPLHLYFNRKSKDITFRQFLIASTAITALFYPWLGLINGALTSFGVENSQNGIVYGTLYFYVQTYSLLYKRSHWSVIRGIIVYLVLVIFVVVAVLLAAS